MRRTYLFVLFAVFTLSACAHRDSDSLGYLKPPPELSGLWQSSGQPLFGMEFLSDHEYRDLSYEGNATITYNTFKIFHMEDGMAYAIVREIWDDKYPDGQMTEQEREQAEPTFLYMKFDLSREPETFSFNPGEAWLKMLTHTEHCSAGEYHGIQLSEADFNLPAEIHWQRVQPGGPCQYTNGNPPFSGSSPYSRKIPWPPK